MLADDREKNLKTTSEKAIEFGRKFFGKKPSHEEVVVASESFSDATTSSLNQTRHESKSIPLATQPLMQLSEEGHFDDLLPSPSERDTDTLFGQLVDDAESLTMYPSQKQIASVKIDPLTGLANHPHHLPQEPNPIDHLLSQTVTVNHHPFESFEYSDSDSELEAEEELHAHDDSHQRGNVAAQTHRSLSKEHHKEEKTQNQQKEKKSKRSQPNSHKKAGTKAPSQRQKTGRSKSPPNVRRTRSPSSSPLRSAI
jgi:hypothetical protein